MVDPKYLYVAREYEERVVKAQGKPLSEIDLLLVKDDWLRIRVGGINQLANIRGYRSLTYPHLIAVDGKASCSCQIEFIPNYESGMEPLTCSALASACRLSMDKNMMGYLEAFAENRAFSRCVKRALQINILSDIEVGGDGRKAVESSAADDESPSQGSGPSGNLPHDMLAEKCQQHAPPITFEHVKVGALKYAADLKSDPNTWTGFASIPPLDVWLISGKIDERDKAAAKKG